MIQKRDNLGFPSEVWNFNPADVEINREKKSYFYNWKGEKHERYTFDNPNGTILHIKLLKTVLKKDLVQLKLVVKQ